MVLKNNNFDNSLTTNFITLKTIPLHIPPAVLLSSMIVLLTNILYRVIVTVIMLQVFKVRVRVRELHRVLYRMSK